MLNQQRGDQIQQGASKAVTGAGKEIATVLDHGFSSYLQFCWWCDPKLATQNFFGKNFQFNLQIPSLII